MLGKLSSRKQIFCFKNACVIALLFEMGVLLLPFISEEENHLKLILDAILNFIFRSPNSGNVLTQLIFNDVILPKCLATDVVDFLIIFLSGLFFIAIMLCKCLRSIFFHCV